MFTGLGRAVLVLMPCIMLSCSPVVKQEPEPSVGLFGPVDVYRSLFVTARKKYPADEYLIGIGEGNTDQAAVELARADLLKQVRSEVRVTWTDIMRERRAQLEQDLSRQIDTQVSELITGLEIVERGRTATGWSYAVAILKKDEIAKKLHGRAILPSSVPQEPASLDQHGGIWVTAEGVVSFGDEMSVAEARLRSRNEARRQAVERAVGIFVKGSTVVYNFVLAEDLVDSVVRGVVIEEQILSEDVREVDIGKGQKVLLHATTLRARVKPVPAERRGNFGVKGTLNKSTFLANEEMLITVVVSDEAYIHIFNVGQDNAVTVLFPNKFRRDNFLSAKKELIFPDDELREMGIRLRVVPPPGANKALEKIKLIATKKNLDLVQGKFNEAIFRVYQGTDTGLVTDLIKELTELEDSEWAEMTVPYEVLKK